MRKSPSKIDRPVGVRMALLFQFGSKYINVAIQLVLTMILARLLTPEEFGLIAIVTVFSSFFMILSDAGISPAIIQRDDLSHKDHNALLFMTLLLGVALSVLFAFLSFPIAWFYDNPELVSLCIFAAPSILFNALNMVPNGILLKQKRFLTIGLRLIVSTIAGGTVAIIMAFSNCGAYALIANSIVTPLVNFIWNKIASKIAFSNIHFMEPLRKVFRYSAFQMGFSTVNYFSRNLDNLLIGKFINITELGFYDKAYKLSLYPLNFFSGVIGSVLQPYLAKYQNDKKAIFERWTLVAKGISLIAAPVSVLLFVAPSEIILLFYGDQWGQAAPILQILSVSIYFQMVNNPSGGIFQACNHTNYMFAHSLVATSMTLLGLIIGLSFGNITDVAIGISIAYCMHSISILFFLIHKSLHASIWKFCKQLLPEIAIGIFCCILCSVAAPLMSENIFVSLIEKTAIIIIVTVLLYCLTDQMKYLKTILGKKNRI